MGVAAGQAHLKDGHGLGEVVLFHGGGGVQRRQRVVEFLQVAVTEAPVVQVVAQTRNQQAFALGEVSGKTHIWLQSGYGITWRLTAYVHDTVVSAIDISKLLGIFEIINIFCLFVFVIPPRHCG